MEKKERILVVDDDRIIGQNLKLILEEEGYEVVATDKGFVAIEEIKKQLFNVVLLDLVLPDVGGESNYCVCLARNSPIPVLLSLPDSPAFLQR